MRFAIATADLGRLNPTMPKEHMMSLRSIQHSFHTINHLLDQPLLIDGNAIPTVRILLRLAIESDPIKYSRLVPTKRLVSTEHLTFIEKRTYPISTTVCQCFKIVLVDNEGLAASVLHHDHVRGAQCERIHFLAIVQQGIRNNMALVRVRPSTRWGEAVGIAYPIVC